MVNFSLPFTTKVKKISSFLIKASENCFYIVNLHLTKIPFLNSHIPSSPAYDIFISQFIRYARALFYECFILMATRLSNKR